MDDTSNNTMAHKSSSMSRKSSTCGCHEQKKHLVVDGSLSAALKLLQCGMVTCRIRKNMSVKNSFLIVKVQNKIKNI